jgi:ABC-2 type transport system permease protein
MKPSKVATKVGISSRNWWSRPLPLVSLAMVSSQTKMVAAMANVAPVVALVAGITQLTAARFPRRVTLVGASVVGAIAVITVIGPLLHWPVLVRDLSPFTHLGLVPAQAVQRLPVGIIAVVSVALVVLASSRIESRDVG